MHTKTLNYPELLQGHSEFEENNFEDARRYFMSALGRDPKLDNVLNYLITLCDTNIQPRSAGAVQNTKNAPHMEVSNQLSVLSPSSKPPGQKLSIVVIFHLYHEEVVDLCLERLRNITDHHDVIVTTPLNATNIAVTKVLTQYPDAKIIKFPNAGRDIGPFLKCWSAIKKYDICCKIHTKKGVSDYISTWRSLCMDGVLESEIMVTSTIAAFANDPQISLAGSEILYGSYKSLLGNNRTNVANLISTYSLPEPMESPHGFFMGTMFWMRPKHFDFIEKLEAIVFPPEATQKDGMFEHAVERMFGSLMLTDDCKIMLSRAHSFHGHSYKIVPATYESTITTFHQHFQLVDDSYQGASKIIGHFSPGGEFARTISGWIAVKGDKRHREAVIRIDDRIEIDIIGNKYRADLEKHGINTGYHAFNANIPFSVMDGENHNFKLIDKITGKLILSIDQPKNKKSDIDVIRAYDNWNYRLEKLFKETITSAPDEFKESPLVSVVMPTYNRFNSIANAINSVLMQTYQNFELIIIDDGGTDETPVLIASCYNDKRITYKKVANGGVSAARNEGLNIAAGEYIFFLDSDNTWNRDFLSHMVDYMSMMNLDSAYCGMMAMDDLGNVTHYKGCDFSWADCVDSNYVDLNTFGFRIQSHTPTPLFNTDLKRLVDWDYILRFAQHRTISYAPFLGVNYYDGNNDRITNSALKTSEALRNHIHVIQSQFQDYNRSLNDSDYTFDQLVQQYTLLASMPRVTLDTLITAYNHEQYIAQAIESVLGQTGRFDHNIIISDDGSSDRTAEIITHYANRYPDRIKNISSIKNSGLSKNVKRCVDATKAVYVALCEGDDYWTDPRKLAKAVQFLQLKKNHSMVFSQIDIHNISTGKQELLRRQVNLKTQTLSGQDFIDEPSMNLIGNFSCCVFNGDILRSSPAKMYKTRFNEIAVAFYFDNFGSIGFLREPMSVYRQHTGGLWTGSDRISQLKSGREARQMAWGVARAIYKVQIKSIIENLYTAPLSKLQKESRLA